MSDAEIITQVLAGNTGRFEALLRRYAPMVRGLCASHVYDPSALDDLVQESFVAGYVNLHTLRDPRKFGPWIAQITRNKCQSWLRERVREQRGHDRLQAEPLPDAAPDPLSQLARKELCEWVRNQIGSLPDRTREAMLLCYVEGLKIREAAQFFDASESSIKKRLQYGRDQLGEKIWNELGGLERPATDDQRLCEKVMAALPLALTRGNVAGAAGVTGLAGTILAGKSGVAATVLVLLGLVIGSIAWSTFSGGQSSTRVSTVSSRESQQDIGASTARERLTTVSTENPNFPRAQTANIEPDVMQSHESPQTQVPAEQTVPDESSSNSGEKSDSEVLDEILNTIDEVFAASVRMQELLSTRESEGNATIDPLQKFGVHNIGNREVAAFTQIVADSDEIRFDVYADQKRALAASHLTGLDTQSSRGVVQGYFIFELERDASGKWSIRDIDFGDHEDSAKDVDRFLNGTPDAHLLTK